jgi:hypothetical protein
MKFLIRAKQNNNKNKNYTNYKERAVSVDKVKSKHGDMLEMRTETDERHLK